MPQTEQAYEEMREKSIKKILDAAGKVIAKKGRTATIAEVAAEAGVSQGLAYRYFTSKEEIFYALLRQIMQSSGVANMGVLTMPGTPLERLERIITGILELRREHPEVYSFVFQALIDEKLPEDIRDALNEQGRGAREVMRQLVVDGQRRGEIAGDDPDQLVDAIMACLDGLSRRMASLYPEDVKMQLPEARIILRMLNPDSNSRCKT